MARRGVRAPGRSRARPCRRCGLDEWRFRKDKRTWACVPCGRNQAAAAQRRRRQDPAVMLWEGARRRSALRGMRFAVTLDDIRAVWPRDGRCPALGLVLKAGRGTTLPSSPTLDRLNNAWGYERGNIAVISLRANQVKGEGTVQELRAVAAWMRRAGLD